MIGPMRVLIVCLCAGLSALGQSPTVFVAGDSTANNTNAAGWGDPLSGYFDRGKMQVVNRARAGRSARTYFTEGLWEQLMADVKPGDYVLLQLGHNDGGPLDTGRARGSLPGLGEDTKDIALPDGKTETVHTYGWYMRRFIAGTRAHGATPILLSLTVRNIWKDGRIERGSGRYSEWAAELARTENTAFVDVTTMLADRYERMGEVKVKTLFGADHTHTTAEGAEFVASVVSDGLRRLNLAPLMAARSPKALLAEPANDQLPTLFLIGDSTVRNGRGDGSNGQWGWGDLLIPQRDAGKVNVVNRAVGGLSSRTFYTTGHWDRVLGLLKPGDFVVMQFGHNDGGALDDAQRARGVLAGTGEDSQEIDNPITKRHETVHAYGWYLRRFIAETRAHVATPIVCSLVPRKIWKDGHIQRNLDTYAGWAAAVAGEEKAPFIDLNELIAREYDRLGADRVEAMFADEHTHTSRAGAELNARIVLDALRALLPRRIQ
jgi:lysophospholipase L1-like esterase